MDEQAQQRGISGRIFNKKPTFFFFFFFCNMSFFLTTKYWRVTNIIMEFWQEYNSHELFLWWGLLVTPIALSWKYFHAHALCTFQMSVTAQGVFVVTEVSDDRNYCKRDEHSIDLGIWTVTSAVIINVLTQRHWSNFLLNDSTSCKRSVTLHGNRQLDHPILR